MRLAGPSTQYHLPTFRPTVLYFERSVSSLWLFFFHRVGDFSLFLLSAFGLYSSSLFVHRSSAIRFVLSRFEHILVHPKDIPVFSWYHVGFQTTKLCHPQIADLLGFSHSYLNPFRSIQASRSITLSYTDRTDSYGVGVLV